MELYKLNTDEIANIDFIYNGEGSHQVTKIDETRRNELGYYTFVRPPQTENTEYNRLVSSPIVLIDGVYTMTFVYADVTLEEAYSTKETEINAYAESLIHDANSNPSDGVTMDADENIKRSVNRAKDRSNKMAFDKVLTETEKNEAKNDQKLSEYEGKIWDDSDKTILNMMKLDTVLEVSAFDVEAENFTTWIPPSA